MKRFLRHFLVVGTALFLLIGLPFLRSDTFRRLKSGDTDAVASATVALDKPSGEYLVMINTSLHTDKQALAAWEAFFGRGETEGLYNVFEDLSCTVGTGDTAALEMARSFMSQLPENQMKVRTEDPTLMLSKAENGRFDVIIMSAETAKAFSAERVEKLTSAKLITVK